jgi:PmbA protein
MLVHTERRDGSDVELYFEQYRTVEYRVVDAILGDVQASVTRGLGVRALCAGRMGFAYSSELSDVGVNSVVQEALRNSRLVSPSHASLPTDPQPLAAGSWAHESLDALASEAAARLLRRVEEGVRSTSRGVSVPGSTMTIGERRVSIASSRGIARDFRATYFSVSVLVRVGRNSQVNVSQVHHFGRDLHAFDAEGFGREAAESAVWGLGKQPALVGTMTVVLSPVAASQLISILGFALSGDRLERGASFLGGAAGETLASPLFSLTDNPCLSHVVGSFPFDAEGVAGASKPLVQRGAVTAVLHNHQTAIRAGLPESTGNAVRSSYRSLPGVAPSVLTVTPGDVPPEELVSGLTTGLWISRFKNLTTGFNLARGTFLLRAEGRQILNGELGPAVSGAVVAGGFKDSLVSLDAVGCDLQYRGPVGAPSLRLREMCVQRS